MPTDPQTTGIRLRHRIKRKRDHVPWWLWALLGLCAAVGLLLEIHDGLYGVCS